jgi:excisionase family DNA binding protein
LPNEWTRFLWGMTMNASDLYTCSTAAAELGVTAARVRALIAAGRLRATLVGHAWLIEPKALDAVRHRQPGRPWGKRSQTRLKKRRGKGGDRSQR